MRHHEHDSTGSEVGHDGVVPVGQHPHRHVLETLGRGENVWGQFRAHEGWDKGAGHAFYSHLYASQGFYMAGDEYWDKYFPATRDQLIAMQAGDGSWNGDGIGQVYGTAIAVVILQLPYKYLPVFQR